MSAMKDKVEQALKDIGLQTGDKTFVMNKADFEALRTELAPSPTATRIHDAVFSPISGVNVRFEEWIEPGDLLVEQKIWTWY